MQRRIFYTSPIDESGLDRWPSLSGRLKHAVTATCDGKVSVTAGTHPVFGRGSDVDETLAALEEVHPAPRDVRVDLWCSIPLYAAVC